MDGVLDGESVTGPRAEVPERGKADDACSVGGDENWIPLFDPGLPPPNAIIERGRQINGITVVVHRIDGLEQKDLRVLADNIRDRIGSGVICIASARDGQASILTMVTKDLTPRLHAGEILKRIAALAGGRGGGKPDMAQGGTSQLERLDTALESVYNLVGEEAAIPKR